jgi:hypothetical protein
MPTFRKFILVVLAAVSGSPVWATKLYSSLATPVYDIAANSKGLSSADGLKTIHAKKLDAPEDNPWPFKVWVSYNGKDYLVPAGGQVNAEIIWSPDSTAFSLTYSDGGAVGQYHVLIYKIEARGLRAFGPVPNGEKFFRTYCDPPQEPNVGAIRWGDESKSLFIAVEVPPHSSCASMGTFRVVEITIPEAKALRMYSQLEAKRLFAESLGDELNNADDEYVELLKSCIPPGVVIPPRPGYQKP